MWRAHAKDNSAAPMSTVGSDISGRNQCHDFVPLCDIMWSVSAADLCYPRKTEKDNLHLILEPNPAHKLHLCANFSNYKNNKSHLPKPASKRRESLCVCVCLRIKELFDWKKQVENKIINYQCRNSPDSLLPKIKEGFLMDLLLPWAMNGCNWICLCVWT